MFAASLSTGKTTSVVRVDPATGRLERVTTHPKSKIPLAKEANEVHALVAKTAQNYDVDPLLVESVIQAESAYQPGAVSPKGAQGLMQLMPSTARRFGVSDAFDPQENIEGGVRYLKYLQNLFQDDRLAIAAYNAGEGAVAKYSGVPPYKETVAYVEKVAQKYGTAKRRAAAQPAPEAVAAGPDRASPTRSIKAFFDAEGRLHMTTQ